MKKLENPSVYVGTYRKYNNGSIFGRWIDLSDFTSLEEFYEACADLHMDEEDPEYMFQDYENIPDGLIGESWISKNYFEFQDVINNLCGVEQEAFYCWCENGNHDLSTKDPSDLISSFESDYIGEYDSEEDFAREYVENYHDLSEFALMYFDYEAYAKDLFSGSYWSDGKYIFSNF